MARSIKPSDKLNPKVVDQFSSPGKSVFANVYNSGGIPCRLSHGSVQHKLQWTEGPEGLNYDPILLHLAEGLKETAHPYTFVAREGFITLCEIEGGMEKVMPLLARVLPPLRMALLSKDIKVVEGTLRALEALSNCVKAHLNPHLKMVLTPFPKWLNNKTIKDKVLETLYVLEGNGHKEALQQIKKKIPTYMSVCS